MRGVACFLGLMALSAGCVLENQPIEDAGTGGTGGITGDAGLCGGCPDNKPVCTEALQCVECTSDQDDYCTEQALICNAETSTCVECLGDADCTTQDAARCDLELFECVPCNDNGQCTDIEGLPNDTNVCDEGECVDCTPALEAESCVDGKSCNPLTRRCTDTDVSSLGVCEACVADSECGDNGVPSDEYRCVPMFYEGTRFPDDNSGFCLKTTDSGCEQPFSITLAARPSLSDPAADADYCGINENLATCPAVDALLQNQRCPNGTQEECPQPSGLCERVGNLENRCTYRCGLPVQCPADPPADTCGSSGSSSEDYCGG